MNRYTRTLRISIILLCIFKYSICQTISEYENLKFLSSTIGYENVCPYVDYDYYILSVQYGSNNY